MAVKTTSSVKIRWALVLDQVNMLVTVDSLKIYYDVSDGMLQAVDDVSFEVGANEVVGILGESGGGKSTLAKSIIRDLPQNGRLVSGEIQYKETDLTSVSHEKIQEIRWDEIACVPQNAMNSLDPVYTIENQITETISAHRDIPEDKQIAKAREVLDTVGIDPSRLQDYPHQMSGGMKQRIVLALSLVLDPDLIIADEPTTGLDVLLRDKILADIEQYREEFEISILIISHDIADLVETCDRLMVMYGGKIVEKAPSRELIASPRHPYTMGLKNSLPAMQSNPDDLVTMSLDPPDLRNPPEGCRFMSKCPVAIEKCDESHPDFFEFNGAESACYRAHEAEKIAAEIEHEGFEVANHDQ